jgi:hypothetical protein
MIVQYLQLLIGILIVTGLFNVIYMIWNINE